MNIRSPVVALCTLFTTTSTFARPPYPMQIPNGTVASCSTCHPGADRSIRNVFGIDAAASNPGAENGVNWIVLCPQDSDDDGETNGFELGDPDCFWTMGTAPSRTNNITRPGDPTSFGGGEGEGEGDVGEGEGEPLPVGEGEGEPLPVAKVRESHFR